jgi:hypothetical protein
MNMAAANMLVGSACMLNGYRGKLLHRVYICYFSIW